MKIRVNVFEMENSGWKGWDDEKNRGTRRAAPRVSMLGDKFTFTVQHKWPGTDITPGSADTGRLTCMSGYSKDQFVDVDLSDELDFEIIE